MWIKEAWKGEVKLKMEVNQPGSRRSTEGNKCQCRTQRRWSMARKTTIEKRMERNMEKTKTPNEGRVREL